MAQAFNLTAQINLRGPSNIGAIAADIRNRLGSINANVNLNISPATTQNVARLNAALNNLNTTLGTTSTNANRASAAIRNFGNSINAIQIRNLPQQINNTNAALNNLNANGANVARTLANANTQMVDFGRQSALAVRRFAAFSVATGAIYSLSNAINQGIKSYIDYNKEIVRLQQVTGESARGLKALENQISTLATSFGVSSTELTTVSLTLAQAGLNARDTEKALKALALSSLAPSFDNMNATVEGSIALMKQFGISAGDLEKALGSINSVAAKFAVEASDIITAIQRTGGVFATASRGVSEGTDALNEFISVFTSVRATTRESSETIATGLRTIFTRIQRGSTIEALKEYGVNLQDLDGKFVGAYKAVELLSSGLNKIDPRELKFSKIVEELGGFRQIGKVIPLIQQFSTAQEALKVAQTGQSSLTKDAATAQLSLANQISKVREEFLALFREIGSSTSFQVMIKNALSLASAMIRIADSMKEVLPVLGTILAFRGANALVQYGAGFAGAIRGGAAPARRAFGGSIRKYANGDEVQVPVALMPGETVFYPQETARVGTAKLRKLNYADKKMAQGGGVSVVPGQGNTDSFYTTLPVGSFVIRKAATEALGGPAGVVKAAKYATGGVINIESSKPYVKNIPTTYDKAPGASIYQAVLSDPKLVLSKNDKIDAQIIRKPIFINDLVSSRDKLFKEYQTATSSRRGVIFENMLLKAGKISKKADSPTSRLDAILNNTLVEIKSTKEQVSTLSLLDKVAGAIFRPRSDIDKIASNKASSIAMSSKPDTMSIGQLLLYEDATRLGSAKTNSNAQTQIEKLSKKRAYDGGLIQKLVAGEEVTAKNALKYMSLSDIVSASKGKLAPGEVNTFLKKRSYTPQQQSLLDSILAEAQKASNRQSGAARGSLTRRKNRSIAKGLVFGAAGLFGTPFASNPLVETIDDARLKQPVTVSVYSGIFKDQKLANKLDKGFDKDIERSTTTASKAILRSRIESQKKKVNKILGGFASGKELNLDFDRTLAFGADKILSDPRTPKFSEFGDRDKVSQALGQAKLSLLGNQIVSLLKEQPGLINKIRIITARPKSTLDLIQGWLSSKGLPVPLSQFKGFGGPSVSGSDVAKLKAAELNPGSIFVDDDPRNIAAARTRSGEDIEAYRYRGVRKPKTTQSAEETESIKGGLLEGLIRKLGAVGTGKGRGFDFLSGLGPLAKEFKPFLPSNIPTDIKRTLSGLSTVKDNIVTYLKNVKGYNAGGEVPILAQEGEYVIQKSAAQRIGYSNLERLNKYHSGGIVRRFARGGSTTGFDPSTTRFGANNILIPENVVQGLTEFTTALNNLGITTTRTNELLRRGGQITYQAATQAYEADLRRLRLVGSMEQIIAAEQNLYNIRRQSSNIAATSQRINDAITRGTNTSGLSSGEIQQNILNQARIEERRLINARGGNVTDQAELARIRDRAFLNAARSETGTRLQNVSGRDVQTYIQQSMMDRRTLAEMDRQYVAGRSRQLQQLLASGNLETETANRLNRSRLGVAAEAEKIAREETAVRRRTLNEIAKSQGNMGPGATGLIGGLQNTGQRLLGSRAGGLVSGVGRSLSGNAGFFIPMAAATLGSLGDPIGRGLSSDKATQGKIAAQVQSSTSTLGVGLGIAGGLAQTGNPYAIAAAGVIALGTGLYAAVDALFDFSGAGKKAAQEIQQAERTKSIEKNSEEVAAALKNLETNIKNINFRQNFERTIRDQTFLVQQNAQTQFQQGLENNPNFLGRNQYYNPLSGRKMEQGLGNLLSRGVGALGEYAKGTLLGSSLGYQSSYGTRNISNTQILREQSIAIAGSEKNQQLADMASRALENRILSGEKISSLGARDQAGNFTNDAFMELVKSISLADAGFYTMEESLKGVNKDLQESTRAAYFRAQGEKVLANLLPIEKTRALNEAMELANRSGRKLADNLNKLADGMEQAVASTAFFSDELRSNREYRIGALEGNTRATTIRNRNINILQNPLSSTTEEYTSAVNTSIGSMFGNNSNAQRIRGSLLIGRGLSGSIDQALSESMKPGKDLTIAKEQAGINAQKAASSFIKGLDLGEAGSEYSDAINKEIDALSKKVENDIKQNPSMDFMTEFRKGIEEIGAKYSSLGKRFVAAQQAYTDEVNKFLSDYSSASKQLQQARNYLFKAEDIGVQSFQDIRRTQTGVGTSLTESQIIRDRRVGRLTGGQQDPFEIAGNILNNTKKAEMLRTQLQNAAARQDTEAVKRHTIALEETNNQIDDSRKALEDLANSTDVATAALENLSNIRALQQQTIKQTESLLTAGPEENFRKMLANRRLGNILSGNPQANAPSREVSLAFGETLRQTRDFRQAKLAAEQVRSQQRQETLSAYEDERSRAELDFKNKQAAEILKTRKQVGGPNAIAEEKALERAGLTDAQINAKLNEGKARVLAQFARESGQLNNPNVQRDIARLRNPDADLAARFAADEAKRAAESQQKANEALSILTKELINMPEILTNLDKTIRDLGTRLGIAQQNASATPMLPPKPLGPGEGGGRQQQVDALGRPTGRQAPLARAKGGIVYASKGMLVNYEPKGEDKIPAMLAEGEFVINDESSRKYRPVLEAINNKRPVDQVMGNLVSMQPAYASNGGIIYMARGGRASVRLPGGEGYGAPAQVRVLSTEEKIQRDKDRADTAKRKDNEDFQEYLQSKAESSGLSTDSDYYRDPTNRAQMAEGYARQNNLSPDREKALVDKIWEDHYKPKREAAAKEKKEREDRAVLLEQQRKKESEDRLTAKTQQRKDEKAAFEKKYNSEEARRSRMTESERRDADDLQKAMSDPAYKDRREVSISSDRSADSLTSAERTMLILNYRAFQKEQTNKQEIEQIRQQYNVDPARAATLAKISDPIQRSMEAIRLTQKDQAYADRQERKAQIFSETQQRLSAVISQEQATIAQLKKDREQSGWFGSLNRGITGVDTYEQQIQDSERRIANAQLGLDSLRDARNSSMGSSRLPGMTSLTASNFNNLQMYGNNQQSLDTARGLAGLPRVNADTYKVTENPANLTNRGLYNPSFDDTSSRTSTKVTKGKNILGFNTNYTTSNSAYQSEEAQLTASRDIAIDVLASAIPAGGGAAIARKAGTAGIKQAAKIGFTTGFRSGILTGAISGGTRGIEDYTSGRATAEEALANAALETSIGGVAGGVLGGTIGAGSRAVADVVEQRAARLATERATKITNESRVSLGLQKMQNEAREAAELAAAQAAADKVPLVDPLMNNARLSASRGQNRGVSALFEPTTNRTPTPLKIPQTPIPAPTNQTATQQAAAEALERLRSGKPSTPDSGVPTVKTLQQMSDETIDRARKAAERAEAVRLQDQQKAQKILSGNRQGTAPQTTNNTKPQSIMYRLGSMFRREDESIADYAARLANAKKNMSRNTSTATSVSAKPVAGSSSTSRQTGPRSPSPSPAPPRPNGSSPLLEIIPKPIESELYRPIWYQGRWAYANKGDIGNAGRSVPTGYKPRYSVKEGMTEQFMESLNSDKELSEYLQQFKQFRFDGNQPKGAADLFNVLYTKKGDIDSAIAVDRIVSTKYKDLLVEGGGMNYGGSQEFSLSKYGSARYDANMTEIDIPPAMRQSLRQDIAAASSTAKNRPATLSAGMGRSMLFEKLEEDVLRKGVNASLLYDAAKELPPDLTQEIFAKYPELFPNFSGMAPNIPTYRRGGFVKAYANGGIVYANNGALASAGKGIDTELIGAAPGEFMVNRESARANMPILQAINSGHFNRGGIVQYLAKGGIVAPRYYANGGAVNNVGVSTNTGALGDMMGQINALKEAIGSIRDVVPSLEGVATSINTGLQGGAELLTNASNNLLSSTKELRDMPSEVRVTEQKQINIAGVSQEWNKYEGDLLNMAGEQSAQSFANKADRINRRSEGNIDITGMA